MTRRPVPHQITLIAFTPANDTGAVSVCDIVETSYKLASWFIRSWMRQPDVTEVAAIAPNTPYTRGMPRRRLRHRGD